jgi:ArsR family transcriptional regulator, arsenate/arsenite/antimonite-responsive transcriptional repressor
MMIDMIAIRFERCQYVRVDDLANDIPVELCCTPLSQGALDEEQATELAEVLKALADPIRLRLVSIVASSDVGEVCACDLPALVERSQPTVSHHLSLLVRAGVLDREQRGKWAWFRLRRERLAAVSDLLVNTG